MNLKEALTKQGSQALTDRINKVFHYDRESGKVLKIVLNHKVHWDSYVSGLVSATSKGDPDEREAAQEFLNYFKSNVELQQQKIDQLKALYPPEFKDTTILTKGRYPTITFDNVLANVSHVVWFLETGDVPDRIKVIDGDHSNTRFSNLSVSTNESASKPFQALVMVNGRQKNLGMFATREEVAKARDEYREKHGIPKRKPGRPASEHVNTMKPYQAVVLHEGRQHHLGRFDTPEEVRKAREAFRERHGKGKGGATFEKPAAAAPLTPQQPTTSQELPEWMR